MKILNEYGEIEISVQAIRRLVYFAVLESYGPVNIESDTFLGKFFSKEEEKIKVEEMEDGSVNVDVYLELEYGVKIPEVCKNIIDNVRHTLKEIGGVEEVNVNVHVIGLR